MCVGRNQDILLGTPSGGECYVIEIAKGTNEATQTKVEPNTLPKKMKKEHCNLHVNSSHIFRVRNS